MTPQPTPQSNFIESAYAERFGGPSSTTTPSAARKKIDLSGWIPPGLRQVPRKAWVSFGIMVFALAAVLLTAYFIFFNNPNPVIDRSLPREDQQRQADLETIRKGLNDYFDQNNQQYPILVNVEIGLGDDPLTAELLPLYLKKMPTDPNAPEQTYHYTSLTGKSFRLSAELSSGEIYTVNEENE